MVLKELVAVICLAAGLASSVPYQYNGYPATSLTTGAAYNGKQNLHGDLVGKFAVGYKPSREPGTTKVKKEFGDGEYPSAYGPEGVKRPYAVDDFLSFEANDDHGDEGDYSSTAGPLVQYPYSDNQLKFDFPPAGYSKSKIAEPTQATTPATADSKVFVHHGAHPHPHHYPYHKKKHFVHDVVGHYISDVAGHKIKHVGEVLESGALNEPIIHKLFFAKAALLPLLAIIGSLSAVNGIHFVAKASADPHPHGHGPEPEGHAALAPDHEGYGHHEYHPNTLVGLVYHFMSKLSKFNTEAKVHFLPNLLRIVSKTSSSSAHVSAGKR